MLSLSPSYSLKLLEERQEKHSENRLQCNLVFGYDITLNRSHSVVLFAYSSALHVRVLWMKDRFTLNLTCRYHFSSSIRKQTLSKLSTVLFHLIHLNQRNTGLTQNNQMQA